MAAVGAALALRFLLNRWIGPLYPYAPFFIASLACGWWAGLGPGLASVVLGALAARYFLAGPAWHFLFQGGDSVGLILFAGNATVLIFLFHRLRAARSGLETQVTQLAKARVEIQKQADLLDLAQDAIISLDSQGVIEFWNKGAEQMYGWSAAEALGRVSPELFEAESIPPFSELRQILRERGAWQGEISHKRKDGSRILVSSHWALKRNADGSPAGFLEITRDITERKRLEEQLRETARMESLGLLAGGIAHDFNNLLVGVLGNAWLVLEYLRPETREHALLEQLIRSADRMS
ncbi:MAG: PAS domain S-box protein, partial [Acidobacteriia bacterium]|nr:PAS domain S-box protein [Terriglobia bacterium]